MVSIQSPACFTAWNKVLARALQRIPSDESYFNFLLAISRPDIELGSTSVQALIPGHYHRISVMWSAPRLQLKKVFHP